MDGIKNPGRHSGRKATGAAACDKLDPAFGEAPPEAFGKGLRRKKMASGVPGKNKKPPGFLIRSGVQAYLLAEDPPAWISRSMAMRKPMAIILKIREVPPKLTKGRDRPLVGIRPVVTSI